MGRRKKYPEHKAEVEKMMDTLLDELVSLWTSIPDPEVKEVADELEMSRAKVRKLLITAGVRDREQYYSSPTADAILRLWKEKKDVPEIQKATGMSRSSITGYLPHTKVYNLDTMSAEAERIKQYRKRKKAVEELHQHLIFPDAPLYLWKAIIAFENYPFQTSGRGARPGVRFIYTVSSTGSTGGRHYTGESVPGYGNELWITTLPDKVKKEKSISRSTVELGYRRAIELSGLVKGPKALGLPGAGSYAFPILVRFGVIKKEPE